MMVDTDILKMMERNWFQEMPPGAERRWTFEADIRNCERSSVKWLLTNYAEAVLGLVDLSFSNRDVDCIKEGVGISLVSGQAISVPDLVKFIHTLTLSEYALSGLAYLPKDLRERRFEAFARDVTWPLETFRKVELWWLHKKAECFRNQA